MTQEDIEIFLSTFDPDYIERRVKSEKLRLEMRSRIDDPFNDSRGETGFPLPDFGFPMRLR